MIHALPDPAMSSSQPSEWPLLESISSTVQSVLGTIDWTAIGDFFAALAPYFPFAIAGTIVWGLWVYRFVLSRRARPIRNEHRASTSVIVPSYHEDPDILMECLESWRAQEPDEIIIVLDVEDLVAYDRITALGDPRVRPILFHHVGKRSALGAGIRLAQHELLVLTDSDTRWQPELLRNVQMPFIDPQVGGVGTQQNVYQRNTSVWRRVADWGAPVLFPASQAGPRCTVGQRCCPCSNTLRTNSSSAAAVSPAMTDA
jgi:N-acetylglucosaminyltransferase